MKRVRRGGAVLASSPSKVARVASKVGKAIYRDMNPTGKRIVNALSGKKVGAMSYKSKGYKPSNGVGVGY